MDEYLKNYFIKIIIKNNFVSKKSVFSSLLEKPVHLQFRQLGFTEERVSTTFTNSIKSTYTIINYYLQL